MVVWLSASVVAETTLSAEDVSTPVTMVLSREEAGLGVVRVVVVLGFVVEEGVVLGSVGVGSGVDDDNELTVEGNGIICI